MEEDATTRGMLQVLPRPAFVLLALFACADAALLAAHVVNELAGFYSAIFNLDEEQNLSTWLSSAQFAAVAVGTGLAGTAAVGRIRAGWWTLAVVFVFLSADETALIHEKISAHFESLLPDVPKLPIVYAPLGAACAVAALVVLDHVRRAIGRVWPLASGFALLGCAVALDAADLQTFDLEGFRPLIILEEASELAGTAILAITALGTFLVEVRNGLPLQSIVGRRP